MVDCNWQRPLWHTQKLQPVWREDKRCFSIFAWSQVWQNVVNYRTVPVMFRGSIMTKTCYFYRMVSETIQNCFSTIQYMFEHHIKYAIISLLHCGYVQQNVWKLIHVLKYSFEICWQEEKLRWTSLYSVDSSTVINVNFMFIDLIKKKHSPPAAVYIKPVWQTGFILNLVDNLVWADCMFMSLLY